MWCLFRLPACYLSGIRSVLYVVAYSWYDLFNTTIYVERLKPVIVCTPFLRYYDLTLKLATQHNNLLSYLLLLSVCYHAFIWFTVMLSLVYYHAFIRCTIFIWCTAMLLFCVWYCHAFISCTVMLLFGVRYIMLCFYLVYAIMLYLSSGSFRLNNLLGYEPNASWSFIVHHCACVFILTHRFK